MPPASHVPDPEFLSSSLFGVPVLGLGIVVVPLILVAVAAGFLSSIRSGRLSVVVAIVSI